MVDIYTERLTYQCEIHQEDYWYFCQVLVSTPRCCLGFQGSLSALGKSPLPKRGSEVWVRLELEHLQSIRSALFPRCANRDICTELLTKYSKPRFSDYSLALGSLQGALAWKPHFSHTDIERDGFQQLRLRCPRSGNSRRNSGTTILSCPSRLRLGFISSNRLSRFWMAANRVAADGLATGRRLCMCTKRASGRAVSKKKNTR